MGLKRKSEHLTPTNVMPPSKKTNRNAHEDNFPSSPVKPARIVLNRIDESLRPSNYQRCHSPVKIPVQFPEYTNLSESPSKSLRQSPRKKAGTPSKNVTFSPLIKTKHISENDERLKDKHSPKRLSLADFSESTTSPRCRSSPKKSFNAPTEKKGNSTKLPSDSLPSLPDYDPVYFLRCHGGGSKEYRDIHPADNLTGVWKCQFEPDPHNTHKTTHIVATCGGNVVCLINCQTGQVMKRLKMEGEQFFSLAWTTLYKKTKERQWPTNVLAVGGIKGRVKLLHPEQLVCYSEFIIHSKFKHVSTLEFHPHNASWLFCGATNGSISLYDIGDLQGDTYGSSKVKCLFQLACPGQEILHIIWNKSASYMIAAAESGCFVWKMHKDIVKTAKNPTFSLKLPNTNKSNSTVDGLCMVSDSIVASKCAGSGLISLFNLDSTLCGVKASCKTLAVTPLVTLQWSKTKQDFLAPCARQGTLGCGDDSGNIWLYNLEAICDNKPCNMYKVLQPSRILPFPECTVDENKIRTNKMEDLNKDKEGILINNVTFNDDGTYIVASTANNLVCIWKKCQVQEIL